MRFNKVAFLILAWLLIASSNLSAQMLPGDLNNGDQFRYAFVTSTEAAALSTDITFYNDFVRTAAANNSALDAYTWNAIASTETVDAIDNTNTNAAGDDIPIYLLDGSRVIGNNADLWGGVALENGINLDENLNTVSGFVWTGTISTGVDSNDFELGSGNLVRRGFSGDTGGTWIFETVSPGGSSNNFYALSDAITFSAVPEPASCTLLALGCVGFLVRRKRR